jgi:hypothetical protein
MDKDDEILKELKTLNARVHDIQSAMGIVGGLILFVGTWIALAMYWPSAHSWIVKVL